MLLPLASAQSETSAPEKRSIQEQLRRISMEVAFRQMWKNPHAYEHLPDILHIGGEETKQWLDWTEECDERYQEIIDNSIGVFSELQPLIDRRRELTKSVENLATVPEEIKNELIALHEMIDTPFLEKVCKGIAEMLTAEQKQKFGELQIATMSVNPFYGLSIFEVLDLTDEQRTEMERIKKELEPEFERMLDSFIDATIASERIFDAARQELPAELFPEERTEKVKEIHSRLMRENPEYKKATERILKQGRDFQDRFKVRMFDVLTDEQMAKLVRLVNNPPEVAKRFLAEMKKMIGEQEASGWQPGPGSWQPGDPIPEGYLQQRQERRGRQFPRSE
jgi:Spy/CpxP family protein refolding chaperone